MIKAAYENFYFKREDVKKYDPKIQYFIQDFEIVADKDTAAIEYTESVGEDLDLPF